MKNLIILSSLILFGCSKAPQDNFIGSWSYSGKGKLMTVPLTCSINLKITKEDKQYKLENLSLDLNPTVFGLSGGVFFHDAILNIKDNNTMLTPVLPSSGTPITLTYDKQTKQLTLNPNPCNGITTGNTLTKKQDN
jgi:hypothetical protein